MGNTIYLDPREKDKKTFLPRGGISTIQLENPNNTVVTEIYRSKAQSDNGKGSSDSEYDQSFGFDRYTLKKDDKNSVMKKSFAPSISLKRYVKQNNIEYIEQYNYFPPWLSIWPPKDKLTEEKGFPDDFCPPPEVSLFCKVFPATKSSNKTTLMFISKNPNLKIKSIRSTQDEELGTSKEQGKMHFLPKVKPGTQFYLDITCCGLINQDTEIEIRESDEEGNKTDGPRTGALRVVANNIIHRAHLVFIPFEEIDPANHDQNVSIQKNTRFQTEIAEFQEYINNKAFNQSLIHFTMEVQSLLSLPDDLIGPDRNKAGPYLISLNDAYFDGIPETSSENVQEEDLEQQLDTAINTLFNKVSANYNSEELVEHPNRHGQTYQKSFKINNSTFNSVEFSAYTSKHNKYFQPADQQESVTYRNSHTPRDKCIYIFIHVDKSDYSNPGKKLFGYTELGKHVIIVFNTIINKKKFGAISHEIGHALDLRHTFELNISKLTEPVNAQIKNIKNEQDKRHKLIKQFEKGKQEKVLKKGIKSCRKEFNKNLKQLEKYINKKKIMITKEGSKKKYYSKIFDYFNNIQLYGHQCNLLYETPQTKEEAVEQSKKFDTLLSKLKTKKEEIINNHILVKGQSFSYENFMDYDEFKSENNATGTSKDNSNPSFAYRSFYKWQWDKMRNSKHLESIPL